MSCWVLGNSFRKATTFSRVCFRSRNLIAEDANVWRRKTPKLQNIKSCLILIVNRRIHKPTPPTWKENSLESLSLFRFRLSLWYSPRLLLNTRGQRQVESEVSTADDRWSYLKYFQTNNFYWMNSKIKKTRCPTPSLITCIEKCASYLEGFWVEYGVVRDNDAPSW